MHAHRDSTDRRHHAPPDVTTLQVIKVTFTRGEGCCVEDPVRAVVAYYDTEGVQLAEVDPSFPGWQP